MQDVDVTLGGTTKEELRERLRAHSIRTNEYAETLLDSPLFTVASNPVSIRCAELAVRDLGLEHGGTTPEIRARAIVTGYTFCPLEVGPRLRLLWLDQTATGDGSVTSQGRAPDGSITILSEPLTDDVTFPKGFYLRRTVDALWLRGYRADDEHVWSPDDRIVLGRAILPSVRT